MNQSNSSAGQGPIPKVIHYCWFGRKQKSPLMEKCIASWSKYCPDWEIIEWNEDNFDVNFCPYAARAYKEKRYGFLADAARLKIIYENGGIYLDTDVELRRSLDELLANEAWFGYGSAAEINTGSGFGAVEGHPFVKLLLEAYLSRPAQGKYEVCTVFDTRIFCETFPEFAADHDVAQEFHMDWGGQTWNVRIINNIWHYVIHHYTNTWLPWYKKLYNRIKAVGRRNNA